MSKRSLLLPGLALGLGLSLTGLVAAQNNPPAQPRQQPQGGGRQMKVGVVDIGALFREYKRKDTLEQAVNAERERIKTELEADQEEIRRKRMQLDKAFVPGTDPYNILRDEIKQATYVLELKTERLQLQLKKRVEELTLQILTELETTIRDYGTRHGYDLILKSDRDEQAQLGGQQGELAQQFQERIFRAQISDVLFFANTIEITEHVKQALNDPGNLQRMEQLAREREQRRQTAAPGTTPGTPPSPPGGAPPK